MTTNDFNRNENQAPTTHGANLFESVKERAEPWLPQILEEIAPDGKLEGNEYVMPNPNRHDTNLGSFKFNMDKGIGKDFASGEGAGDIIALAAMLRNSSQGDAASYVASLVDDFEKSDPKAKPRQGVAVLRRKKKVAPSVQIFPVPVDSPEPPNTLAKWGTATGRWQYTDIEGNLLGYVVRFDAGGKKTIRPQTFRRGDSGDGWEWKGFDGVRPLFNLAALKQNPNASVVLVEGEKAAVAAQALFPQHVVVTTMHGAESPHLTNLTPVSGREVLIWPDHDQVGWEYAAKVAEMLTPIGAHVEVLRPIDVSCGFDEHGTATLEPGFTPFDGWDAADALVAGWTPAHVEKLLVSGYAESVADPEEKVEVYSHLPLPGDLEDFLCESFPEGLAFINESFLAYHDGYWRELDDRSEVRHRIACFLGKSALKSKAIVNIFDRLKDFTAKSEAGAQPNRNYICLRNGTLNTQTCTLVPHDRGFGLRSKIPAAWRPEARCDRWLAFLNEIFEPDADRSARIDFLQEWFGYCLAADASQHKFLWLVGGGGNGKSVLLAVLQQLVGRENVSHAHLERLHEGFVRAELDGRLVNISSEMSAEATLADGYFKAIVSGDVIEAARKFKPSFSFRPFIKLICATNHLPRLLDLSDGFFRRAIVLTFNRQFTGSEIDAALESKLLLELDGILGWAIVGLRRLRERGSFQAIPSSVAALEAYRVESDPVQMFADECLMTSETEFMRASEIYRGYAEWCKTFGFRSKNNSTFGKRLVELGFDKFRDSQGSCWRVRERPGNPHLGMFVGSATILGTSSTFAPQAHPHTVLPSGRKV
jgi:putative DNA primase/helicase